MHTAAAALRLYAARDSGGVNVAALGLNLHQAKLPGDVDGELSGELARAPPLPVAHNPGRVSANISADFEGPELAARVLLG